MKKKLVKSETEHINTVQAYAACTCSCSCKCGFLNPAYFSARSSGSSGGKIAATAIG